MQTRLLCIELCILFVFTFSASAQQPAEAEVPLMRRQVEACVFEPEQLIRIPLPEGASGNWAVVDDEGRRVRYGLFREGERAMYLGDLKAGIYYLFWGLGDDEIPTVVQGPENRLAFLVMPEGRPAMTDHFFAARQPELIREMQSGESDARAVTELMARLGTPRLRLYLDAPTMRDVDNPTEINWDEIDELEREATERGVRFVAVLGGNPRSPIPVVQQVETALVNQAFVRELLRRFGFKFDAFALHSSPNSPTSFTGSPEQFSAFITPVFKEIKLRSPFATIALGGLSSSKDLVGFTGEAESLRTFVSTSFGILDWEAAGTLEQTRALYKELQVLITDTPAAGKPQGISRSTMGSIDDSINGQRFQASQTIKKMVWARSKGMYQFTADYLVEPTMEQPSRTGLFWRGSDGERLRPRMLAFAWGNAARRLSGAQNVSEKSYVGDAFEIYTFARGQGTVLAAWVPERPNDTRPDKRAVVTLRWPDGVAARATDMMGRPLPEHYLQRQDENTYNLVVDVDPVFVELNVTPVNVTW